MKGKVFPMGGTTTAPAEVTEKDPFTNLYDDKSVEKRNFNTIAEAIAYIPEKWRAGTQTMRVSELPKEEEDQEEN